MRPILRRFRRRVTPALDREQPPLAGSSMPPSSVDHLRAVPSPEEEPEGAIELDRELRDRRLVARATEGDAAAWARLYQAHFDRLYRDVLYLAQNPATTEEIVQESFAIALTGLRRFDGRSSFSTWLRGIAHNLVRKHWRSHVRRGRAYERFEHAADRAAPHTADDPERSHVQAERAQVLAAVLQQLPDSLRETFVMRDVQGLSVEDVAQRLQTTPGNVRVRANRARARIRAELEQLGWLDPQEGAP
jgi:RNA polymerase sigma-70 factor, ECF subfamily